SCSARQAEWCVRLPTRNFPICWRAPRITLRRRATISAASNSLEPRPSNAAGSALGPLSRSFFLRDTELVARDLLGRYLSLARAGEPPRLARLVEVEAYLG